MMLLKSVDLPLPFTPTSAQIVPPSRWKVASCEREVAVRIGHRDLLDLKRGADLRIVIRGLRNPFTMVSAFASSSFR